jgi:uncharacterized protein YlbG (UPF0298 family)
MSEPKCPYSKYCRLYNNQLKLDNSVEEVYKSIYCQTVKWAQCTRYKAYKEFGEIPDFIMPNSTFSIDVIAHKLEQEKFLQKHVNKNLL